MENDNFNISLVEDEDENIEEEEKEQENMEKEAEKKEKSENTKKKHWGIRITALFAAAVVTASSGFALYKGNQNHKIKNISIEELKNAERATRKGSLTDDNFKTLETIEKYCEMSTKLYNLYTNNKNNIKNLTIGTVSLDDEGNYIPLTESEFLELESMIEEIERINSDTSDRKNQLIGMAVSYSSNINAYLKLNSLNNLSEILTYQLKDDTAKLYGTTADRLIINHDEEGNYFFERIDNNNSEYSYNIPVSMLLYRTELFGENLFKVKENTDNEIEKNNRIFNLEDNTCPYDLESIKRLNNIIGYIKELEFYDTKTLPISKKEFYYPSNVDDTLYNYINNQRVKGR